MTTNRFQPGDKVRVLPSTQYGPVSLGLNGDVYTVAHVDDFGLIQVKGNPNHFHPSHFELVMRAVADESYCLKDGEGDWWVYKTEDPAAEGYWYLVDDPAMTRDGSELGAQGIIEVWGVDDTPAAAPETYCLKDGEGDWWVSDDTEGLFQQAGYPHSQRRSAGYIESTYGIDAEPIPAVGEVTVYEPGNSTGPQAFQVGDHVEYIGGGTVQTERLVGQIGTVAEIGDQADDIRVDWDDRDAKPRGVLAENLRKVTANDPAPLQPGDWVKVLARVEHVFDNGSIKAQTFQSDGTGNGPAIYAVASAITRTDEVPEWAKKKPAVCPSLHHIEAEGVYIRCEDTDGHVGFHGAGFSPGWKSWDDSDGRAEVTER